MSPSSSSPQARDTQAQWPVLEYNVDVQPTLLLLLTPAYAGSTAIADFLAQPEHIGGMQHSYEAQRLVPGIHGKGRWESDMAVDYESVNSVWMHHVMLAQQENPKLRYIVEKSPPNMMRYDKLTALFENSRIVCNNRNPYACISSMAHGNKTFVDKAQDKRNAILVERTEMWLKICRQLKKVVDTENCPVLVYEDFCEKPSQIFEAFGITAEEAGQVSDDYLVKAKNRPPQIISNMNHARIDQLRDTERDVIRQTLAPEEALLESFGFGLNCPD